MIRLRWALLICYSLAMIFFLVQHHFAERTILHATKLFVTKDENLRMENSAPEDENLEGKKEEENLPIVLLARSIGNALPPRHHPNQTLTNLKFILQYEARAPNLRKHWFINRIYDQEELEQVIQLLMEYDQNYTIIPFDLKEYATLDFDLLRYRNTKDTVHDKYFTEGWDFQCRVAQASIYEPKIFYTMPVNPVRNQMIEYGIEIGAEWILPWDQNCFVNDNAYRKLMKTLLEKGHRNKYFITYMDRIHAKNEVVLDPGYKPNAWGEPQIVFRRDATERFDTTLRYGRGDKIALLTRLRVRGPWWNLWAFDAYERKVMFHNISNDIPENHVVPEAGWVARLNSGRSELEKKDIGDQREWSRWIGIKQFLDKLDAAVLANIHRFDSVSLLCFDTARVSALRESWLNRTTTENSTSKYATEKHEEHDNPFLQHTVAIASRASDILLKSVPSVLDKSRPAPSGDMHDIFIPAFAAKHRMKNDMRFDGGRLREVLEDFTIVALAWMSTHDPEFFNYLQKILKVWFLDQKTKVNPTFRYAGVLKGSDRGSAKYGLEFTIKLCYFLDAVRLIAEDLPPKTIGTLFRWMKQLLHYFLSDEVGRSGFYSTGSLGGLFYDLNVVALAAFTHDVNAFNFVSHSVRARMIAMFDRHTGRWIMPSKAATPFGATNDSVQVALESWSIMGTMARNAGVNVWDYAGNTGKKARDSNSTSILCNAVQRYVPCCQSNSEACTNDMQIRKKWLFIAFHAVAHCPGLKEIPTCVELASTKAWDSSVLRMWADLE